MSTSHPRFRARIEGSRETIFDLIACQRPALSSGYRAPVSFAPGRERLLERAFAGRALLDCQNRAPAVFVHERNIEPGLLFEHLQVTLHFAIGRREADEERAGGHLCRNTGEARPVGLL